MGELTSASRYEEKKGIPKGRLLAHALADAFIAAGDFDSAAALRDEIDSKAQEKKEKIPKPKEE